MIFPPLFSRLHQKALLMVGHGVATALQNECKPLQTDPKGISASSGLPAVTPSQNASQGHDSMARILRPAAASRWMMPALASITPQYVENVLRGALSGNHVQQWELFDLMFDTWPELAACQQELTEGVLRSKLTLDPFAEEGEAPSDTAKERQKLVSSAIRQMRPIASEDENDIEGTLKDILDGWFRGVTVLEVGWQRADAGGLGQIIAPRCTWWAHPSNFGWSTSGHWPCRRSAGLRRFRSLSF